MLTIRIILVLAVFIVLSVIGWSNTSAHADVNLLGRIYYGVPVALVMLYSFAFGALCIGILSLVSEIQLRTRLRRQRLEMEALLEELRALRNAPLDDSEKPDAPAQADGGEA